MTNKFKVGDKIRIPARHNEVWAGVFPITHIWESGVVQIEHPELGTGAFCPGDVVLCVPRDYVADHARRSLRKLGLTKQEAAAFVRNCQTMPPDSHTDASERYDLSHMSRQASPDDIECGFTWSDSPEGHEFWSGVFGRVYGEVSA